MNPPLYYILDEHGDPQPVADVRAWGIWFETAENRVLLSDYFDHPFPPTDDQIGSYINPIVPRRHLDHAVETIDLRIHVSTVFLGMDHQWGEGPPVLWETMIFGGPLSGQQWRYTSKDDAIAGHANACDQVKAAIRSGVTEDAD